VLHAASLVTIADTFGAVMSTDDILELAGR
jgi:hypothetical protein